MLMPYPPQGGILDQTAFFLPVFLPMDETFLVFERNHAVPESAYLNGSLSVEINSAANENNWVVIEVMGTVGITSEGKVNRDGIGAVVTFTPKSGQSTMKPVVAGSSHASQDTLAAHFGLGKEDKGTVDVLWPGGVRNRLVNVNAGERLVMPEIPCGFDGNWDSEDKFKSCVEISLRELKQANVIDSKFEARLSNSMIKAFKEHNDDDDDKDDDDEASDEDSDD